MEDKRTEATPLVATTTPPSADAAKRKSHAQHLADVRKYPHRRSTALQRLCTGSTHTFWASTIFCACLFCFVWICITSLAPKPIGLLNIDPATGAINISADGNFEHMSPEDSDALICPRGTVCAETWGTVALLAVSRTTAYGTYPLMMLIFLSKTNHLRTLLQSTCLALYIPFYDLHELHTFAGKWVAVAVGLHAVAHTIRWSVQGTAYMLYSSATGVSGSLCILCTPLIVLPMMVPRLKKALRWEVRKGLHTVCSVIWGVSITFHAPHMWIWYLMGIPVGMYLLDAIVGGISRTYKAVHPVFTRLECGTELVFDHPKGFHNDGAGYVMVCLPWISIFEWHAFSLFLHPTIPNASCVCMNKLGDWTTKLHDAVRKPTSRPAWICGPFASPYSHAQEYDNLVLVASGIGITPAMSIVAAFKATRRVHVIWACRDPSLLEFYLEKVIFDDDAWTLIYYTGKRKLQLPDHLPPTVLIFNGRPNFDRSVREMIIGIEHQTGLPEEILQAAEECMEEGHGYADQFKHAAEMPPSERFDVLIRKQLRSHGEDGLLEVVQKAIASAHKMNVGSTDPTILDKNEFNAALEYLFEPGSFTKDEHQELIERFDEDKSGTVSITEMLNGCRAAITAAMREPAQPAAAAAGAIRRSVSERKKSVQLKRWATTTFAPPPKKVEKKEGGEGKESSKKEGADEGGGRPVEAVTSKDPDVFIDAVGPERLATWGMLYCGGSQPVVDSLQEIKDKYGIGLEVEKFDW